MREETLRAANLAIIGYHGTLPLAAVFGSGTLSSSDGQRFPVRGKTLTGRDMVIHGGQVLSTCTHVTDQHTTYGTKIIVATRRRPTTSSTRSWATPPTSPSPNTRRTHTG